MPKQDSSGQTTFSQSVLKALKENARNERIVTYGQLAEQVGLSRRKAMVVVPPLKRILKACQRHGYPWLTAIVVNQDTCRPGEGFTDETDAEIEDKCWRAMVQKVYDYDWSKVDDLDD